jgi:hypothetical protein
MLYRKNRIWQENTDRAEKAYYLFEVESVENGSGNRYKPKWGNLQYKQRMSSQDDRSRTTGILPSQESTSYINMLDKQGITKERFAR